MYFIIVVTFLILILKSVFGTFVYSNTSKGWCFSECVHYDVYDYCYTDWKNWDYCYKTQMPVHAIMSNKENIRCTSHCGKYGYNYNWCLTGKVGSSDWEYCTPNKIQSFNEIEASLLRTNVFQGWKKTIYTDPGEENICLNKKNLIGNYLKNNIYSFKSWFNEYNFNDSSSLSIKDGLKIKISKRSSGQFSSFTIDGLERGFYQYALPHRIVNEFIAILSSSWPQYVITPHSQGELQPIINYFVSPAPPITGQTDNVPLTHFIQARIYGRHLGQTRHRIPGCADCHMDNLDRRLGDQRGHLLAVSLGGGNDIFNIVPQPRSVNVGVGTNSFWRCTERDIVSYLQPLDPEENPSANGHYVEWRLAVHYGNIQTSRRPTGFFLQLTYYDAQGNIFYESPDMYFSNQWSPFLAAIIPMI